MTTLCRFCVCYDFLLHRTVQNESEQRMIARILDGTKIRDQIFAELKDEVRLLTAAGVRPGLAAVLVGHNPASQLYVDIKIEGANAVVLGRSDIVGKPMALLLMHANATVTICHSKTRDLPGVARGADILVAAMGKAGYVEAGWIKPGAAVIDVGTNRVTDSAEAERLFRNFPARLEKFRAKGSALVGDVHPDAIHIAGALTPVPGGVGPMTITMLMSNTVKAARLRRASPRFSATQSTARAR